VGAFLLDVNVLLALAWSSHSAHARVGRWFARHSHMGWATCPFTQAGFVRLLANPVFSRDAVSPQVAIELLEANLKLPGHEFWPASIAVPEAVKFIERRITGHRQVTDAYLLGLAIHRGGRLATLDEGIGALGPKGVVEIIR
jgi:toxin-antitoxin system PIN domain toxin